MPMTLLNRSRDCIFQKRARMSGVYVGKGAYGGVTRPNSSLGCTGGGIGGDAEGQDRQGAEVS